MNQKDHPPLPPPKRTPAEDRKAIDAAMRGLSAAVHELETHRPLRPTKAKLEPHSPLPTTKANSENRRPVSTTKAKLETHRPLPATKAKLETQSPMPAPKARLFQSSNSVAYARTIEPGTDWNEEGVITDESVAAAVESNPELQRHIAEMKEEQDDIMRGVAAAIHSDPELEREVERLALKAMDDHIKMMEKMTRLTDENTRLKAMLARKDGRNPGHGIR